MQRSPIIELPHDAFIDTLSNKITLALGNVNLIFTLDEWNAFHEMMDDINVALQTNLMEQSEHCSVCGHTDISILYEEPADDELN